MRWNIDLLHVSRDISGLHEKISIQITRFENGREIRFEQLITDLVGGAASSSNIFPSMLHWNMSCF